VPEFHGEKPSMRALETLRLLALAMTACGPPREPAAVAPAPTNAATKSARGVTTREDQRQPEPDEWAPLSWEERHDLMTWSLLPAMMPVMKQTFATVDPELNCRTCHGANAEAVAYAMPNGLPPLDPRHMPTGKVAEAMRRDVTPLLSEILGKTTTCFSCHPSAEAEP
jgi:hypothetical protein